LSTARIGRISGSVLHARVEGSFHLREAVQVGEQALLGEVVRLREQEIVVQVYEDTTGLRPGTQVVGTGLPLSVRLGPGLLGGIFDGLLRPLAGTSSPYLQPGMRQGEARVFPFVPKAQAGERLPMGSVFGQVHPAQGRSQSCLVPPVSGAAPEGVWVGEVISIAHAGEYPDNVPLCTLRGPDGSLHELAMSHPWPVRAPRPIQSRLPGEEPMLTGQRIVDCLFPLARGGKAAIPGGFGTGKTVLLESLAKWCNADIIVYVGCGERGNEMAGLLEEFPLLQDPRSGRPLMERTVIIANTSNMPVAGREASIYTAVTIAEYFRDQGLHVALMADSTSRWAEALREVSGGLGELPGEAGYPAYLSSRLAEFYERAARVVTLGGQEGSLSVMGAVSPPSGDFSEPVVSHTKRYVRTFWALDVKRAQARFYPAIHPLLSYSEDAAQLAHWWQTQGNAQWPELRRRFLLLLGEQAQLERMARIIGKDALPVRQQLTLLCAELVNEAFLRQSSFSDVDRFASPARQTAMMRLLGRFIQLAEQAVAAGHRPEQLSRLEVFRRLQRMGEEIPEGAWEGFKALELQIEEAFVQLHGVAGQAS
jgi:V/A-type H+/Na+-transporting ATPase subunit A